MKIVIASLALTIGVACGGVSSGPSSGRSEPGAAASPTPSDTGPQAFDGLTITLHLSSTEVESGGEIQSEVVIKNKTERPVTDPGCLFHSPRFALVPEDDPESELWGAIIVDCAGPSVLHPGESERSSGPTFRAADKYGEPLPPGDYLAVMDLEERTERVVERVMVTPD